MTQRLQIALAVFLIVFASVVCWQVLRFREPVYQGKVLNTWLKGLDYGEQSIKGSASRLAIRHIGTNALPTLIAYLRYRDPPGKHQYAWFVHNILGRGDIDFEADRHRQAARACAILGTNAQPAFTALVEASSDPQATSDVAKALYAMLPVSVPVLTNLLVVGRPAVRCEAAQVLGNCYGALDLETSIATALTNALHDPDLGVRRAAAAALAVATNNPSFALPALTEALANTNGNVLVAVISSISKLTGNPAVMVPQLRRALANRDGAVRLFAINSLGGLGAAARPAFQDLIEVWREIASYPYSGGPETELWVGESARMALQRIDSTAAVAEWVKAINHGSARLRANALLAVGSLPPNTINRPDVISCLVEASQNTNSSVRNAAFFVLGWVAPESDEVFSQLTQVLADNLPESASAMNGLTSSLSSFPGNEKKFIPLLLAGLKNANEFTRRASTNVLQIIDAQAASKAGVM